jgi:hypothetical protein
MGTRMSCMLTGLITKAQAGDAEGAHAEGAGDKAIREIFKALLTKVATLAFELEAEARLRRQSGPDRHSSGWTESPGSARSDSHYPRHQLLAMRCPARKAGSLRFAAGRPGPKPGVINGRSGAGAGDGIRTRDPLLESQLALGSCPPFAIQRSLPSASESLRGDNHLPNFSAIAQHLMAKQRLQNCGHLVAM